MRIDLSKTKPSDEIIVQVEVAPRPYPVYINAGGLTQLGAKLRPLARGKQVAVITDATVGPLYGEIAVESLRAASFEPNLFTVPAGEQSKSFTYVENLYDELADAQADRDTPIVALGGGVVGDLAGFVAATWVRGVPFVQCPTTLEADVDSSVGGKTAVNHTSGKNMIGAFYQPLFVLIDTDTLRTLSQRDFRAGLAESVKHGVIRDAKFFEWQEQNVAAILEHDPRALATLIEHNVRIKANVVADDERETTGLRALLNFGHTLGHAIETALARRDTPWRHGEAVAVGMIAACEMSAVAGLLDRASAERIIALLDRIGLPTRAPLAAAHAELFDLMHADKKATLGRIRFVLAESIGKAKLYDTIEPQWIDAGLKRVCT